ncbi:hypothetical protein ACJJTC_007342 [Scirpophaga incertulas]
MPEMPDCMIRRYKALDDLIAELGVVMSNQGLNSKPNPSADDTCMKLMCEFWNILKEDPQCNLTHAICDCMGLNSHCQAIKSQNVSCYLASKGNKSCSNPEPKQTCCSSTSIPQSKSTCTNSQLGQVLCNLKQAVSFENKCNTRISELMKAQKYLQEQIQELEQREKEGIQMLKQADYMWSCMEEAYKKKVAQSLERQNILLKQMKEIESSNTKWRKNKQDLEFQLSNIDKCRQEIKEKLQEKESEATCVNMEIENFKKRSAELTKEIAETQKSFDVKKHSNELAIQKLCTDAEKLNKIAQEEHNVKMSKEKDGSTFIKEAREDLQKIYKVLLEKKIENEDLGAEKDALQLETHLLINYFNQCKHSCAYKQKAVKDEIERLDAEMADVEMKLTKCNVCADTDDIYKFCTDCPKCADQRKCIYEKEQCCVAATDCVCTIVKNKFMDNVFENLYNVLERRAKSGSGKIVADAILKCLRKSRDGKLNEETREIIKKFILTTIKKNLNVTIIGGAVKTKCEMDPETYQQLMLCLKHVKPTPIAKEEKGTVPRKEPCTRWNTTQECNCSKGPKGCICSELCPPPARHSNECGPERKRSPQKDCGTDNKKSTKKEDPCASHSGTGKVSNSIGAVFTAFKPPACDEKHCILKKNMRAAQCVLGPDALTPPPPEKTEDTPPETPSPPDTPELDNVTICECGSCATKHCTCLKGNKKSKLHIYLTDLYGSRQAYIGKVSMVVEEVKEKFQKFVIKE